MRPTCSWERGRLSAAIAIFAAMLFGVRASAQMRFESEPNNAAAQANPLFAGGAGGAGGAKITGNIYPGADADWFSFSVAGPARVYAATMIANSAVAADTVLDVVASNGVAVLESDDNDGTLGASASNVAGVSLPSAGTYFVRVRGAAPATQVRPYDLYLRAHASPAAPEQEPNNALPAPPMPSAGLVAGAIANAADIDLFSIALNAGDTVFACLDLDPERDGIEWNGMLSVGDLAGQALAVNDAGNSAAGTPDSEALFMTVRDAGDYFLRVAAGAAGATGTYALSVAVIPASACPYETFTQTNSTPTNIADAGITSSVLFIPGNPRCGRVRIALDITHARLPDLDVELLSPAGNVVSLFTDVGTAASPQMNLVLDDEAAVPIGFYGVTDGARFQPESISPGGRMDFLRGLYGGGPWLLIIRDDLAGGGGGTLNSWSLEICEDPPAVCPPNATSTTAYFSSFESDGGGFTHSGAQDEWERGMPSIAPIGGAYSGIACWKTDLDNTYNANSSQNLLSPPINLAGFTGPILLRWAQELNIESASADHAYVEVQNAGGGNVRRVWEWLGPSMNVSVGAAPVTLNQSIGWALIEADISAYAGQSIQVRFHLDSDGGGVPHAGLAIDDVSVVACDLVCPGDANNDAAVNVIDLLSVITHWGACPAPCPPNCSGDVTADCAVNVNDLLLVITNWGACP